MQQGDPYLVSLGNFLMKDYIKSLNAFKIDSGSSNTLQNMMKPNLNSFDIAHIPEVNIGEEDII